MAAPGGSVSFLSRVLVLSCCLTQVIVSLLSVKKMEKIVAPYGTRKLDFRTYIES